MREQETKLKSELEQLYEMTRILNGFNEEVAGVPDTADYWSR